MSDMLIGGGQSSAPGNGGLPPILAAITQGLNQTFNPEQQPIAELAQLQTGPEDINQIIGSMPFGAAGTVGRQIGGKALLFGRDKLRDTTRKIFGPGEANRRFVPELTSKMGAAPGVKGRYVVLDKRSGFTTGVPGQASEFSTIQQAMDAADELELTAPANLTLQLLRKGGPFGGR